MESANGKGSMGMAVRSGFGMLVSMGMDVDMAMLVAIVRMLVNVQVVAEGFVKSP